MCVRCLREGFIDEFPWPGQDGPGDDDDDGVVSDAGGVKAQIAKWWADLQEVSGGRQLSISHIRPTYVAPIVLSATIAYILPGSRDAAIAFNTSIYMSLAASYRIIMLDLMGIKKKRTGKSSKKRKKEAAVVLCQVIAASHTSIGTGR